MERKKKPPRMEQELRLRLDAQDKTLKDRLDAQDRNHENLMDSIEKVFELLKGSTIMNYPGIIKQFQDMEDKMEKLLSQIAHWERWRQNQIAKKGTFTFKTANLLTRGLSVIGGVATIVAIIYTITQIIDWYSK